MARTEWRLIRDNGRLYVAIEGTNEVWALYPNDAGGYFQGKVITGFDVKPNDVTYDRFHHRLYVSIHHANEVAVVDTNTETLVNTVPVLWGNPTSVAVNPINRHVYVGQNLGNQISVVDGATETALPNIVVGGSACRVDVDTTTAQSLCRIEGVSERRDHRREYRHLSASAPPSTAFP